MTAEPSVRDRAAEVLLLHRVWRSECACGATVSSRPDTMSAHIADALAAAGLLAGEAVVETVTVHEHQWVSDHTYEDGPNRDPQRCIGGCGRTRVIVTECPDEEGS